MKYNLYSVFDRKTGNYGIPFPEVNDVSAQRAFATAMKKNDYAEDMELYRVGNFDIEHGMLIGSAPEFIVAFNSIEVQNNG